MSIIESKVTAYHRVGGEWREIEFFCDTPVFKEMPPAFDSLVFSGEATLNFAEVLESISTLIRIKPEIENWKSYGKRKMPRIK